MNHYAAKSGTTPLGVLNRNESNRLPYDLWSIAYAEA